MKDFEKAAEYFEKVAKHFGKLAEKTRLSIKYENGVFLNVDVNCEYCGEPIIKSDVYGMRCKNDCGLEESKMTKKAVEQTFPFLKDAINKPCEPVMCDRPRLYYFCEGNPDTTIPILTDNPKGIRNDLGNQDHGGMDWEDFVRVCDNGEIKQVKSINDLPLDLMGVIPYTGGEIEPWNWSCGQLCQLMDEDGNVTLE
jgi:hypothetical protein